MGDAIRVEDDGAVRNLVLCRPEEYNTITPVLRGELGNALDDADRDRAVRGPAASPAPALRNLPGSPRPVPPGPRMSTGGGHR
jgi:hypothetical protein